MKNPIPTAWLPDAKMRAVVLHWTAGTNSVSSLDLAHYHFIIDGSGKIHRGNHSIKANESPLRGDYAAHALNFNGGAIGVSLCGMAGAVESPFLAGQHPINATQWQTAQEVVAQLCTRYGIAVTPTTVLQHGEIQANCGVIQRGKWDCCRLPWVPQMSAKEVCSDFRAGVIDAMKASGGFVVPAPVAVHASSAPRELAINDGKAIRAVEGAALIKGHHVAEVLDTLRAAGMATATDAENTTPQRLVLKVWKA